MRRVLKNSHEVFHYWANQIQSIGESGNVFFRDSKVFSYGSHFCIARILPSGAAAFTTRGYSVSTSRHISQARSAACNRATVFCHNPADSALENMRHARNEIRDALTASEKKGIRQTTRDKFKAQAYNRAVSTNAYLAALPEHERGGEFPIDTAALEQVRAEIEAAEVAHAKLREELQAARMADLQDSLVKWRAHEIITRTGLYELPIALRVNGDNIETTRGADIPVHHARRFWPLVQSVRAAGVEWNSPPAKSYSLGVYTLRTIRADGSIVVGCHDIAYSELAGIAQSLGLVEQVAA